MNKNIIKSREITYEEIENEFVDRVWNLVDYWKKVEGRTEEEKIEGVVFSILTMLDGCSGGVGYVVAPLPHKDDKEFHIETGENYYPENHNSNVKCNISGCLHEIFSDKGRRKSS